MIKLTKVLLPLIFLFTINSLSASSLITAIKEVDMTAFDNHLANNPDSINQKDWTDKTPLYIALDAAMYSDDDDPKKTLLISMAVKLLNAGADPDVKSIVGVYPIHLASSIGELELVQLLVKNGADIDEETKVDFTPLMYAATDNRVSVVKFLLESGADVDAEDEDDYQALHWAAFKGNLEVVKLLVEHGADLDDETSEDETALHLAMQKNRKSVIKFIEEERERQKQSSK